MILELERQRQVDSWSFVGSQGCPIIEVQASERLCLKKKIKAPR